MLAGRAKPELGGGEKYLDIIGGNYYMYNQWLLNGPSVDRRSPRYRPFRKMVKEVYDRYQRPFFVAETGTEDEARRSWFSHVSEVREAIKQGVQVEGICLYPILNHPGCYYDYADEKGRRESYRPLADELQKQRRYFKRLLRRG